MKQNIAALQILLNKVNNAGKLDPSLIETAIELGVPGAAGASSVEHLYWLIKLKIQQLLREHKLESDSVAQKVIDECKAKLDKIEQALRAKQAIPVKTANPRKSGGLG